MTQPAPAIVPTSQNRFFWEAARDGQLAIQRCLECRQYQHPPLAICCVCHSSRVAPAMMSGRGRIYSLTAIRRVFHAGFAAKVPYVLALIELCEQPNLFVVSNLVGAGHLEAQIDADVVVAFEPHGVWMLPVFRLRGAL